MKPGTQRKPKGADRIMLAVQCLLVEFVHAKA